MKKRLLFLSLLLLSFGSVFANTVITERGYRWRNDDGDATTATFKEAENTEITVSNTSNLRLRVRLEGDGTTTDTENRGLLEYSTTIDGDYTLISDSGSPFSLVNSSYITSGQSTTQSLLTATNTSLPFEDGKYFTAADNTEKTVSPTAATEFEYVIALNGKALPSTTYFIRVSGVKNSPSDGTVIPKLTTAATLPVGLTGFTAVAQSNGVDLRWATLTEQDNEKFVVERSSDGNKWTTVLTVNGKGNSSSKSEYSAFDRNPMDGINYYQLKQYDFDGTEKLLALEAVKFSLKANVENLSVYPNPVVSDINFRLTDFNAAGFKAFLVNTQGQIIHQENFATKSAGATYTLNLKNRPASGLYVLKIQSENLALNASVVVN